MDEAQLKQLRKAVGAPSEAAVAGSRRRVRAWFSQAAPLIQWDVFESPLGPLYIAATARGLVSVNFGVGRTAFLSGLEPMTRTEQSSSALAPIVEQLRAYFAGACSQFDVSLDLSQVTPFQLSVLQTARLIPSGTMWTYGEVARAIGKPKASRAVGQALGRNPVPIVIPCHRVVASDGSLGGYSGGGGLDSKRLLLHLEGAR